MKQDTEQKKMIKIIECDRIMVLYKKIGQKMRSNNNNKVDF